MVITLVKVLYATTDSGYPSYHYSLGFEDRNRLLVSIMKIFVPGHLAVIDRHKTPGETKLLRILLSWGRAFVLFGLLCATLTLTDLIGGLAGAEVPARPAGQPHILLLYSYGYGGRGVELFNDGLFKAIGEEGFSATNVYSEFLDLERNQNLPGYRQDMLDMLRKKYGQRRIDLIVTVQQPALDFLLAEGKEVAPQVPVITIQHRSLSGAQRAGRTIIGEINQFDIKGTLGLALQLFPRTTRVVFASGSSAADLEMTEQATSLAKSYKGRIEFEYTTGMTFDEILHRVAHLPSDSIIIFTQYNRDSRGRVMLSYEAESRIVKAASAPVFGFYDYNLKNGGIGGSVIPVELSGVRAGRLAMDILKGRPLSEEGELMRNVKIPIFDWGQIQRWGGDISQLPPNTVFVNRPPSMWQLYGKIIGLALTLILGQLVLIFLLLVNVRRRKHAENVLSKSEAEFRSIFNNIGDGIVFADNSRRILRVNQAFMAMFGYSDDEIVGRTDLLYADPAGYTDQGCRRFHAGTTSENGVYEMSYRRKDGSEFWAESIGTRIVDQKGIVLGFIAVHRDITERKRGEESLREAAAFQTSLLSAIPAPVFYKDSDGLYVGINKAFEAFFGRTKQDVVGKSAFDIAPQQFTDVYHAKDLELFHHPGIQVYESQVKDARGDARDVVFHKATFADSQGRVLGLIGVILDITDGKKLEQEISATVARLKEAQRVARIGSWELDLATNQLSWCDQVNQIFEIEPRQFSGSYDAFLNLIHPEDREKVRRAYTDSLAKKIPYEMIHRLQLPDGRIKYVHERCEHSWDASGGALRSVGTAQDITELTQVQLRLESERARLRTLVQTIPDLVWLKSPDGVYLTCNPRFERFFGAKEADIVGKTDYDFVDADLAQFFREHDRKAMDAGKPSINEEWVTFADDGHKELLETIKTPMYDRDGSLIGVLGIARDITATREAVEARKRLATAIEQAAEAILITDDKGLIQYVNPAVERTSGFSSDELLGKTPRVFKSGEHDPTFYTQLWGTVSEGNIWSGRLINRRKDGGLYHEEATISPVRDLSGKITNFVAVKRDITEHLQLAKQLQQSQKMEAVGTLAGGIAHDFNNLLQVVLGYSELVLADEALPDHIRNDLGRVLLAGRSGSDLVQRLLTFSRRNRNKAARPRS